MNSFQAFLYESFEARVGKKGSGFKKVSWKVKILALPKVG